MKPVLFSIPEWIVLTGTVLLAALFAALHMRHRGSVPAPQFRKSLISLLVTFGIALVLEAVFIKEPVEVPAYGFMIMIAFVTGTYLAAFRARRWGMSPDHVIDAGLFAVIFGILGARILFTIQYFDIYFWGTGYIDGQPYNKFWNVFKVWQGGLVFYGGLIGGALAIIYMLRKRKLSIALMADLCMPSVILGLAITRIGCFFNGCCFGRITNLAWAVTFPRNSHCHSRQLEEIRMFIENHAAMFDPAVYARNMERLDHLVEFSPGGIRSGQALTILDQMKNQLMDMGVSLDGLGHQMSTLINTHYPFSELPFAVHPSQLYATASGLLIFGLLLSLTRYRKFDGQIGLLFALLYSVNRFLLEMTRSDVNANLGLTISQWISVVMFTTALAMYAVISRKKVLTPIPIDPSRPEAQTPYRKKEELNAK